MPSPMAAVAARVHRTMGTTVPTRQHRRLSPHRAPPRQAARRVYWHRPLTVAGAGEDATMARPLALPNQVRAVPMATGRGVPPTARMVRKGQRVLRRCRAALSRRPVRVAPAVHPITVAGVMAPASKAQVVAPAAALARQMMGLGHGCLHRAQRLRLAVAAAPRRPQHALKAKSHR